MKIVKLNRRFRQHKEYGHQVGLKFESGHTKEAAAFEKACRRLYSGGGWMRDSDWYSYYGKTDYSDGYGSNRAFWVTLKNEQDLSAILLMLDN